MKNESTYIKTLCKSNKEKKCLENSTYVSFIKFHTTKIIVKMFDSKKKESVWRFSNTQVKNKIVYPFLLICQRMENLLYTNLWLTRTGKSQYNNWELYKNFCILTMNKNNLDNYCNSWEEGLLFNKHCQSRMNNVKLKKNNYYMT